VVRYQHAVDDEDFERDAGVELLVETARLWHSLGHRDAQGGFRIDGVTGPDEYSAIADNNVYTNLMARCNLRAAAEAAERHPNVARSLGVDADEAASWRDAATAIVIPYDERRGVHSQAERFTDHDVWDFEATKPEQYPLLLHFPYFDLLPQTGRQAGGSGAGPAFLRRNGSRPSRSSPTSTTTSRSRFATRRYRPAPRRSSPPRLVTSGSPTPTTARPR